MTTIQHMEDTENRAETAVERAEKAFETAIAVLEASCDQLKSAPEFGEGEVTKAVRQMNAAFLMTMDMQEKAREAGVKRFGNGGGGQLDLDAARSEIGLRLACLRKPGA
ncbi:hypothetical protein V8J82_01110 [Gymnodinialimonas sp. 2305UL16-5]|uniref:hypothetical protein n=1 Tax=Gymnodinialimonas mytili TaxID=3126503 RepID=UPI0030B3996D